MDSLKDATSARKLCNRAVETKPAMIDARMVQGAHDYIVGSLPGYMKMLGFLAGFRGDKEKGIQALKLVAEKGDQNQLDARILLGVIYRRERRAGDAVPLLRELIERFPRNYLFRLELSQMYADLGDKTNAVAVLNDIDRLKKAKSPGYERITWERLAFARGNLLFWYSDYDAAIASLKIATANPQELDLNSGIMSWMRLGQCYDVKQQRQQAIPAYESAVKLAPASEAAKEAKRYLNSPYVRKPRG
jgi:tetratricopeptide (TPR) repeat protein